MRTLSYPGAGVRVAQPIAAALQGAQDKLGTFGHTGLWKDRHLVAEGRIRGDETLILRNRRVKAVMPFAVGHIDFGPGRSQKYAMVVAMRSPDTGERRLARPMLESDRGVDQTSVKE